MIVSDSFVFNPEDGEGEQLNLVTKLSLTTDKYYDGPYWHWNKQTIELWSTVNSTSIELRSIQITPAMLRKAANQLEKFLGIHGIK